MKLCWKSMWATSLTQTKNTMFARVYDKTYGAICMKMSDENRSISRQTRMRASCSKQTSHAPHRRKLADVLSPYQNPG